MAISSNLQPDNTSMADLYEQLRKMAADMTVPPILITATQKNNMYYSPSMFGGVKSGHLSTIMANARRGKSMYFINYEAALDKDYLDILCPGNKPTESMIMCQRARKIFDSCTTEPKKVSMTSYAYKILDSENSYFLFDYSEPTGKYGLGINRVQLRVGNLIIPLPINELPIGANPFISTTPNPANAVERVIGEIADFVSDYFDDFGYYADAE